MSKETDIQKLIKKVDQSFEHIILLRIWMAKTRIMFFVASGFAVAIGYYYSQVALNAAVANLLELSVALQSLSLSLLALVISMVAVFNNEETRIAESRRLAWAMFKKMREGNDPLVLTALVKMKRTIPKSISLEQAYLANPELFSKKELAGRLLEN
jgi:hypothetical protein